MQMSKNALVKGQVSRAGVGAPPERIAVLMQLCADQHLSACILLLLTLCMLSGADGGHFPR